MVRPLPLIGDDDLDQPRGKRTQRGGPCSDRTRAASVAPPSYRTSPSRRGSRGRSEGQPADLAEAGDEAGFFDVEAPEGEVAEGEVVGCFRPAVEVARTAVSDAG